MKIRVIVEGEEIDDSDLVVRPAAKRTTGAQGAPARWSSEPVDLWLSIALGYQGTPPKGTFEVENTALPSVDFPHCQVQGTGAVQALKIAWQGAGATLERELLLLHPLLPTLFYLLLVLATPLLALCTWSGLEALASSFGGTEASKSTLVDLAAGLVGLGAPALALRGVTSKAAQRWAARYWPFAALSVVLVGAGAFFVARTQFVLVVNQTPDSVEQVWGHHVELGAGESAVLFRSNSELAEGNFEACGKDEPLELGHSLSAWIRHALISSTKAICCRTWPAESAYSTKRAEKKTCAVNPAETVGLKSFPRFPKAQSTYLIQPYAYEKAASLPPLAGGVEREMPTLEFAWPAGAIGPYSHLAISGEGFLRETRIRLPLQADAADSPQDARRILQPWREERPDPPANGPARYLPLPQLRASLRAGEAEIGTLVCAHPGPQTRIEFFHTGPFVRQLLLQDADDLDFVSAFSATRPEMVTEIPLCVPQNERALRVVLYLDSGFQPEGWNLRLDGSGPLPNQPCLNAGSSTQAPCGIAKRLRTIQVHLPDGSAWGHVDGATDPFSCKTLAALRADDAGGGIAVAAPSPAAWTWRRNVGTGLAGHEREFWICREPLQAKEPTHYGLTLSDGSARLLTRQPSGSLSVGLYPLRSCRLKGNLKELLPEERDANPDCGPLAQRFSGDPSPYLSPGCGRSSVVCLPKRK